jgi:hypothetical protein
MSQVHSFVPSAVAGRLSHARLIGSNPRHRPLSRNTCFPTSNTQFRQKHAAYVVSSPSCREECAINPVGLRKCRKPLLIGFSDMASRQQFAPQIPKPTFSNRQLNGRLLSTGPSEPANGRKCRRISGACVRNPNMQEPAGGMRWAMGICAARWSGWRCRAVPEFSMIG